MLSGWCSGVPCAVAAADEKQGHAEAKLAATEREELLNLLETQVPVLKAQVAQAESRLKAETSGSKRAKIEKLLAEMRLKLAKREARLAELQSKYPAKQPSSQYNLGPQRC